MCGMIFFRINKVVTGSIGMLLATVLGITLSLLQVPGQGPIPVPRYLPLVFVVFLSIVSLAIILVVQGYIHKYLAEKRASSTDNNDTQK